MKKVGWSGALKQDRNRLLFLGIATVASWVLVLIFATSSIKPFIVVSSIVILFHFLSLANDAARLRCVCGNTVSRYHKFCYDCGKPNSYVAGKKK